MLINRVSNAHVRLRHLLDGYLQTASLQFMKSIVEEVPTQFTRPLSIDYVISFPLAEVIDYVYREEGDFRKAFETEQYRAMNTVTRMQARYRF